MLKHTPLLLAALLAGGGALAQQPPVIVGATAKVEGLVTVSIGATVANVVNDSPVIDGARYVTSSSGRASLKFSDGCLIELGPSQALLVDASTDCPTRIAAVRLLSDSAAGGVLAGNARLIGAGLALGAAAASMGGGSTPRGAGTTGPTVPDGGSGGVIVPITSQ